MNHFRRRAAFREIAKVFGYTEEQITKILKSHKTQTKRIMDTEIQHLLALAEKIKGKPRFLGRHPERITYYQSGPYVAVLRANIPAASRPYYHPNRYA